MPHALVAAALARTFSLPLGLLRHAAAGVNTTLDLECLYIRSPLITYYQLMLNNQLMSKYWSKMYHHLFCQGIDLFITCLIFV